MVIVERFDKLGDIPSDVWNSLLARSEINTIFLTWQWINCWWDVLGGDSELLLLVAKEDGEIVGIAPLMISRKVVRFISTGETDYCDFIVADEKKTDVLTAFFDYLRNNHRLFNRLLLDNIPERSSTVNFIRELAKTSRWKTIESVSSKCSAIEVRDKEEHVGKSLRKNDVKTRFNYLNKNGKLEYCVLTDIEEIDATLDGFFELHKDRRLLAGDSSKFLGGRAKEFYRKLADAFLPEGWLRFNVLKFNDELIACHFGFLHENTLLHYTPTFNLDYFKRSPGLVLMKFMIEECIENQIELFDFTRGAEGYKKRFATVSRNNIKFEMFLDSFRWSVYRNTQSIREKVKSKSPRLFNLLKKVLSPSTYSGILRETAFVIRKNGIPRMIVMFFQQLIPKLFFSMRLIIYRRVFEERDKDWTQGDFVISEGNLSDLKIFVSDTTLSKQQRFLQQAFDRLRKGHRLFVVEKDNKIVHYSWVECAKVIYLMEIDTYHDFKQDTWYIYHSYTSPEFRGKGIYTAVLRFICDTFADTGVENLCGYVLMSNFIPHKGVKRTGATPMVEYNVTRLLGLTWRRHKNY